MDPQDKTFSELAGIVKSLIPWRSEPPNVSRDFWMPDQSCRVCYECDSQFTIFNRKHHCRLCGRVFCARCTANSVPAPSGDQSTSREECEKIRKTDDEYGVYRSDSETRHFSQVDDYYSRVDFDELSNDGSHKLHHDGENDTKSLSSCSLHHSFDSQGLEGIPQIGRKGENDIVDECEEHSSIYAPQDVEKEPVDFENNGLLWLPPEPEDEEDEREIGLFDDDDDGDAAGEWGYLRSSSSFGSGESRNRDRSGEEHKKAMKNVVDGHFRALVAQLLQVENLPVGDEDDRESWLEIITAVSWEAATLLKPDMSKGGGMDPGGYVKVKCVASGRRSESEVVKGVVCKKNVAHRRMTSKIEKPRLLILGGALEYQRVSNLLSSFDTLLQQEKDHLKMAVAKIDAHNPDILLVEKSVSGHAQEFLLAKDISLVLNIKRPLLDRIARCTGAQIVPSIDHLLSPKLGYCDAFHVERFLEDHGTAGHGGKKLVKTLMYFEGCPKPLGCTILLRGANGDDLKKVKHVVQYGVFAAYHLAVETSFLADEGASLPELPLNSPINVALPEKSFSIERSISTVPGFSVSVNGKSHGAQHIGEPQRTISAPVSNNTKTFLPNGSHSQSTEPTLDLIDSTVFSAGPSGNAFPDSYLKTLSPYHTFEEKIKMDSKEPLEGETSAGNNRSVIMNNHLTANGFGHIETLGQDVMANDFQNSLSAMAVNQLGSSEQSFLQEDCKNFPEEQGPLKEDFPPSPSDHQSILVSLSSRCVWKGTVCERSHLFRIKYYGNFDKPLGRFLRDHLFDQSYQCRSCGMPSEAHVHCYTHRQGTLTISVKKLQETLLRGEREGKIWMWHRCLRCPRTNGFPPATRRVVMSDAAWGLSFGKFLELSFSNHAAASRVASCGHSLHRDCLRFYGFGKMVACFRYASIDVHSVYLPPPKLDFNYKNQDWIQKEIDEVQWSQVWNFEDNLSFIIASCDIVLLEKRSGARPLNNGIKTPEMRRKIAELEGMLQKEKLEFEESIQKTLNKGAKKGQPVIDILDINRLRRQLLFQSYLWDHRLIYVASLDKNNHQDSLSSSSPEHLEKPFVSNDKLMQVNVDNKPEKSSRSCDFVADAKLNKSPEQRGGYASDTNQSDVVHQEKDMDQSDPIKSEVNVRRTVSDGQFPIMASLSDTLDAAWTGENHTGIGIPKDNTSTLPELAVTETSTTPAVVEGTDLENQGEEKNSTKVSPILSPALSTKSPDNVEDHVGWLGMPFLNFYRSFNKNFLAGAQKFNTLSEYNPVYISSFRQLELQGGARLLLPVGVNDTVIPVYDDEPTSIISYALVCPKYHMQLIDEGERPKDGGDLVASLTHVDSVNSQSILSVDDIASEYHRSLGSSDDSILSMSGSRGSLSLDPLSYTKALHARVSFGDDGPLGKVNYTVTCYYAMRFEALRKICCPSELDFIRSLSRCKKWGAQGGKSNVFFAKTLDDRFIIKQVTKTELESFIKFAPGYFKYLSESINSGSPTCLAKILGIYQVTSKHLKGGKETKIDVLVMENLLFQRNVTRLYDLKGSSRSRYNPDSSGSNKVLLDQNLIEAMPTSPIFVGNKAKRLLERAVWNDTSFLASIDVMDYSLLVGVDEEKHELVLGIIDFMRQYTWDKHLETWVKASGILGGPKNSSPTVISPKQYKKRFRKAMTTYFLMVPDQWSPPSIIPSKSLSDLCEDNAQGGTLVE
ncbi:1-phosphatidylinositol-3-phosphate 5-kinase fab1b [Quercus suber]|uniref:1-phosphatidylinositol-3-phosphate 5-kinase n=1 Tax=Quercus suber TaxID=58331 RepID=A0AAW0J670_QUESU